MLVGTENGDGGGGTSVGVSGGSIGGHGYGGVGVGVDITPAQEVRARHRDLRRTRRPAASACSAGELNGESAARWLQ